MQSFNYANALLLQRIFTLRCLSDSSCTKESLTNIHGNCGLADTNHHLFICWRRKSRSIGYKPSNRCAFGRRQNNEDADQYFYLYHKLRLCSATDLDDILVWSELKLTLYEPNCKEKEVHWPIRATNSGLGSAFLYSLPLPDLYGSAWNMFICVID